MLLGRTLGLLVVSVLTLTGHVAPAADTDIVVNEVLYHPPADLEDAEFLELYNRGPDPVDLSGWKLANAVTFNIPNATVIASGGYLIIVKSLALASSLYPGVARVGGYTGNLANGGERIRLLNDEGLLIDEFDYFDDDGWPGDPDGTGASLEKISPERDPWFADNWGASLTLLGSPGRLNTRFEEIQDLDLVLVGEDWRYFKGTEEPAAGTDDWSERSFPDASWLLGPTGIGYGDNDDATVLADMLGAYSTIYLRRQFTVTDPTRLLELVFTVDFDDGFIAYLNGVEVARRNVPGAVGSPLPFNSLAMVAREPGLAEAIDLTAERSLLVAGGNVLALHVINQSLASTDLTIIPSLRARVLTSGAELSLSRLASASVIPRSSTWTYFKGTAEPSATLGEWTSPGFVDAAWSSGPAGFGYGDNDDATVLNDMLNGYSTLYIRKTFPLTDLANISGLQLGVDFDDGFIVYLNGIEVARAFAPGTVGQFQLRTAVASGSHEAGTEQVFDLTSQLGLLIDGDNVLAVHGFNTAASSGDFSLHPRLTLFRAVSGDPAALTAGVSINEVYRPGGGLGFVEIHNACPDPVDISGYGLSDDPTFPQLHVFPPSTLLAPGEFHVVAEASLGFALPTSGTLMLTDAAGVVLVDGKSFAIVNPAFSVGSHPEGRSEFASLSAPTSSAANAAPPDFGVIINEIQYHPITLPGAPEVEWLELHNTTAAAVLLTGWRFTRGIDFAIPAGTVIAAGGYRVFSNNPAAVQAKYGITGVLGGYTSGLRNDDEVVMLRDHLDNEADRVHYADDGRWPVATDGTGPSAELVNPALNNGTGQAWRASPGEGTPGAINSTFATSAMPVVTQLQHFPPVPRAGQTVLVTARVDALNPIAEVRLFHRLAGGASFTQVSLLDDGVSGDGAGGDGLYAVTLPGQPAGSVVEFFVEAEDSLGEVRLVPPTSPGQCHLYLVDDTPADIGVPVYRVVMTPADRVTLATRDVFSDVLLNATFIAGDRIFYGVGIRYRGESSRLVSPKSYRVQLSDDEEFEGIKNLNLNGNRAQHQHLGMSLFRAADVPASLTRPVSLLLGTDAALTCTRMEEVDEQFLRRYYAFPAGEDGGNLYRGVDSGDLDYRGNDKENYRPSYKKETNETADDWSDLITLCDKLSRTPEASLPAELSPLIDVEAWIRFLAVHTLISTQEGGIYRDRGDDYFLYRRPSDGRWLLIPWDLDDSFAQPTEQLFRPTLPQIRQILRHPEWTAIYYASLERLSSSHFALERMQDQVDGLAGLFPPATLAQDLAFVQSRLGFVDSQVEQSFDVILSGQTLVRRGDTWRYFRGTGEPTGGTLEWTERGFIDTAWDEGPTGIGYGDNDDATVLADMLNGYSTVYARRSFSVTNLESITNLELSIDYDDGFIAFLNGVEVARSNAGAAGTYPSFDAIATATREAGMVQVFDIPNAGALLTPGTNVLAVVGLNLTIDSTDFSLIPELRTGGVVGEGCPGDVYVTGSSLIVSGLAPVTQTRFVRVNGLDVPYDRFSGAWSTAVSTGAATQPLSVQALDRNLVVVASQARTTTRVHTFGGAISGTEILAAANSPYLVTSSVTVLAGAELVIEPGCDFLIGEGVNFAIAGEIRAVGTAVDTITFTRIPCHLDWGFFTFQSTNTPNELAYCEFSRSTASPGCLTVQGSTLSLESCHIHDVAGEGVSAFSSTITVRNSIVERTNEALSLDFCRAIVEFNTIRNAIGKSDLCDANGSNNPPARIAFNTMHGTSDDAIDADRGSVFAEGNVIRNCGDQGISLVGAGNSTVFRNIVFRNGVGLSLKDAHRATVDFNTFAFNSSIGVRAIEKTSGLGGGIATLKNSIVWGSPTSLFVNSTGVITTTYSDIQGGAPPGVGNISVDPQFVNAAANDYRLRSTSPCIGVAENLDDMGALPFEITPRAPSGLLVTATTSTSVSLGWSDNSSAETAQELHRRVSSGFVPAYVVAEGESWRYFKGRSEPSGGTLDWTTLGFADGSWLSGPTGIGYGDGDDATVLADMQNSYTTVYLRKTFNIVDASAISALELLVDFDDGFIAFLNGVEIARQSAGTAGTYPAFGAVASLDHEAGVIYKTEVPVVGLLADGPNVLAVVGLNILASSSDFTIIPELRTVDETPYVLHATLPANARMFTDAGLNQSAEYSYKIRAINAAGSSNFSNVVSVIAGTLPGAPTDLAVTSFSATSIALGWSDNADNESALELERADAAGEFAVLVSLPAETTSHLDAAVTTGVTYRYRVRAVNGFGVSAYSNVVTQTAGDAPIAPTGLQVTAVSLSSISLRWLDNSPNESSFEVEVQVGGGQFQPRAMVGADVIDYTDLDLASGQAYSYRVRAVNAVGPSTYSNVVIATTGRLPAPPVDLTVGDVGLSFVSLSWVDSADNEVGFELERRGPGEASFSLLVALSAGATAHVDTGLLSGATHAYRVRAVNGFGASAYSNEAVAVTGRLPMDPGSLLVTMVGLDSIALAWADGSNDETGFELERREGALPFVKIADLPPNTVSYLDSGLPQGATRSYRVRANNGFGVSAYSEVATATTGRLPAAPSALMLTSLGVDSLAFDWNDNADNETGFEIERSTVGGPFLVVGQVAEDVTSFGDSGLAPGTSHTYRVRAVNAFGSSPPSGLLNAVTGSFPAAPVSLLAIAATPFSMQISWGDASDNETGFELERRTGSGGAFLKIADLGANVDSYLDLALEPGKEYSYRIRSINEFGASEFVGPVQASTGYPAPEITAISPPLGPVSGGTPIVITGNSFVAGATVTIGGAPVGEINIISVTRIEGTTPAGVAGAADVVVTTPAGTATLAAGFTYTDTEPLLRGDTNSDETIDISDAVYLLAYLYTGGPAPPCDDVANANFDRFVDLSDPIFILSYLFQGGRAIDPETAQCE